MSYKSRVIAIGTALSTALILLSSVGCNINNSENYAAQEPTFAKTDTGRFSAAGSTFLAPLFSQWSNDYEKAHRILVNYRPIGSGAALGELKQNLLTFAASDAPLTDAQLKDMQPLVQIPVTAGPVCLTYNLPGVTAPLRFTGKTLADIYAGRIENWQDPAIARDNPGVKLPKIPIVVFHRLDGSGTSSIFTTYLSAVSNTWSTSVGHGLTVTWPTGFGESGSKAVVTQVKATSGGIGYVELTYAKDAGLPVASIQNRAGQFIAPTPSSAALAIEAFNDALLKDLRTPIVDPPASAKGAYPITGLSFILIPKVNILPGEQRQFKDFVAYCLTDGQNAAEGMSYVRLPPSIVQQGQTLLTQLTVDDKS